MLPTDGLNKTSPSRGMKGQGYLIFPQSEELGSPSLILLANRGCGQKVFYSIICSCSVLYVMHMRTGHAHRSNMLTRGITHLSTALDRYHLLLYHKRCIRLTTLLCHVLPTITQTERTICTIQILPTAR